MYKSNDKLKGFYCLRCGEKFNIDDYFTGCSLCSRESLPISLAPYYAGIPEIKNNEKRLFRYGDFLPYLDFPSLGEGGTPLVKAHRLTEKYNLTSLYIKNEFQNPTGSHKDRMSPFIIARALETNRRVVSVASSGNAGASLAAYAALAGLKCKVVSQSNMNPIWKRAIKATGAEIIYTETSQDRWTYMKEKVQKAHWYPAGNYISPPVGSNPFGVQGYKTISYEIYEDLQGQIPDWILIPTSRGDLLWGIYRGFKDLKAMKKIKTLPRLIAVEPIARIQKVLKGADYRWIFNGDYSLTPSIGGSTVTYQSIKAIKDSNGYAVNVLQEEVHSNIKELSNYGLYLESSTSTLIGALKKLLEKDIISKNDCIVMIATSSGYKDFPIE